MFSAATIEPRRRVLRPGPAAGVAAARRGAAKPLFATALLAGALVAAPAVAAPAEARPVPTAELHLLSNDLAGELADRTTVVHRYGPGRKILASVSGSDALDAAVRSRMTRIPATDRISYRAWSGRVDEVRPDAVRDRAAGKYLLSLAGPIDRSWADSLAGAGLEILDIADPFGFLVAGDGDALARALRLTTSEGFRVVRGVRALPVEARIAPELLAFARGELDRDAVGALRGTEGGIVVTVETHGDRDDARALDRVRSFARAVPPALAWDRENAFEVDAPELLAMLQIDDVAWIEPVAERRPLNNLAAREEVCNVEPVWTAPGLGYNGAGVIVGINDSGSDPSHADLQDPTYGDVIVATNGQMAGGGGNDPYHGTHVTGSVLGRGYASATSPTNPQACGTEAAWTLDPVRGMAWGAQGTSNNIFAGGVTGDFAMMQWSYQNGARLNTNSWGYCTGFGCGTPVTAYNASSRDVDIAVRDADSAQALNQELLILFAAGNDGPTAQTIGTPGNAKNTVNVGAVHNPRCRNAANPQPSANTIVGFSSRGPAQGRIKPDVMAPGYDVLSTQASSGSDGGWDLAWTGNDYSLLGGTSMATPIVAGAAAVLYEAHADLHGGFPSPALAKGLLINGANDTGAGFPSNDQGWGRLDLRQSIEGPPGGQIEFLDQDDVTHLTTGQTFSTAFECFSTSPRLKVTLVWTDPPGSAGCTTCDVNDLDLVVTSPGGTVYRGNRFTGSWSTPNPGATTDTLNNVENVFVQNPEVGGWTVDVEATGVGTNPPNLSGQDFALVYSGDCSSCTAPNAPTGLGATAGFNQVQLTWTGISPQPTAYRIYRATSTGGPYVQVGSVGGATTSFTDTTVSADTQYFYVVRSFEVCESADSNEANATPWGDCTTAPTFGGVQSVTNLGGGQGCGLRVAWNAGTSACGGNLVYNVYRSTSAGFTPGGGTLHASCVADTSWDDTTVADGQTYWYTVRAEDPAAVGAGVCGPGVEETNSSEASGSSSSSSSQSLYLQNFDAATGFADWGAVNFENPPPDDWRGVQACTAASSPNVFRFGGVGCTDNYTDGTQTVGSGNWLGRVPRRSLGGIAVPPAAIATTLTFAHRWELEPTWDGAYLMLSLNNSTFWYVPAGDFAAGGYNGTLTASGCLYAFNRGRAAWTGFANSSFTDVEVDLGPTCDAICNDTTPPAACSAYTSGCAGMAVYVAFVAATDQCTGTAYDGWFLDDVEVTAGLAGGGCTAAPSPVRFLTARGTHQRVDLEWLNPAIGNYGSTMIRTATAGTPADPTAGSQVTDQDDGLDGVGTAAHTGLTNGSTHHYSAFVDAGAGTYSARRTTRGYPVSTSSALQWNFSTEAAALATPIQWSGIGVYAASNTRALHAMAGGSSGGTWPAGWRPMAMNAPAQSQPIVLPSVWTPLGHDAVFVSSHDGYVYCRDTATGAACPGWVSGPGTGLSQDDFGMLQATPIPYLGQIGATASARWLVVGSRDASGAVHGLHAIDLADGTTVWSFTNTVGQGGNGQAIGIVSGAALADPANQRIYFGSRARSGGSPNTLWALDLSLGTPVLAWAQAAGPIDANLSRDWTRGRIVAGTVTGVLHSIPTVGVGGTSRSFGDGAIKELVYYDAARDRFYFSTDTTVHGVPADLAVTGADWQVGGLSSPSRPILHFGTPRVYVGACGATCATGRLIELDSAESPTPWATPTTYDVAGTGGLGAPIIDRGQTPALVHVGSRSGRILAIEVPLP